METINLQIVLRDVISCVEKANNTIMEIYKSNFQTHIAYKDDQSPLTLADTSSHRVVCRYLRERDIDIPILSEEGLDEPPSCRAKYCWIVDPLDGTKEFIKKNGEFTVNIALVENKHVILGVVGVPVMGTIYYATKGGNAFRQDSNGVMPIHVSNRTNDLIWVGSKSHSSDKEAALISKNKSIIKQTISAGSSLKGIMVAESRADVYYRFGPTCEWDTCAMQCIVEEAGGIFSQMDGTEMLYNRENHLNDKGFYIVNREENIWV